MKNRNSKAQYPSSIVVDFVRFTVFVLSRLFWRIEYVGKENIPKNQTRGLLIVSNHQTYFDPFWIAVPVGRKMRFMAWDKAFDWFLIGKIIRYLGAFPVSIERGSTRSFRKAIKALREGANLFIFPEGSREFSDGKLLPFKEGAAKIAFQTKAPILPVTVCGANKIWAQDMAFPRFGKVKIIFHPVLEFSVYSRESDDGNRFESLTKKLAQIIETGFDFN